MSQLAAEHLHDATEDRELNQAGYNHEDSGTHAWQDGTLAGIC
jgi:hypothetical protein